MAQSKINKHGYQMENLREVCSMTKGMRPGSSYHIEIAWAMDDGKILVEEHVGPVGNSWCQWTDGVIPCGYLSRPMTQQEIADQVAESIKNYRI